MSREKDFIPQHNHHHITIEIEGLKELGALFSNQFFLINQKLQTIMANLDELTAAVAKDTEVDQSAITLLNGLKAALDAAGTDPVKLKELSDKIASSTQALADAVVANTPAEG